MTSIRITIDHRSDEPINELSAAEIGTKTLALINKITMYKLLGVNAILIAGLMHLYNATHPVENAPMFSILFILFFLAAIISSIGISWGGHLWGWALGGMLAIGAIVLYLASRTVGIASLGVEKWGPPLAYFSIVVEAVFFVPFIASYSVDLRKFNAEVF